jgi:hypothetical protein
MQIFRPGADTTARLLLALLEPSLFRPSASHISGRN